MTATLITQAQLELRRGVKTVAQYCNDIGGATADATIMDEVLSEAEDIGAGLLLPGFTDAQVVLLAANGPAVRGALLDIAADLMARRRPALLLPDGSSPFAKDRKLAEGVLERAGQAQRRLRAEKTAGTNKLIGNSTNLDPHELIFSGNAASPYGKGGF